jgi:hypothetical protein
VFSGLRSADSTSDIYRIELRSGTETRVTRTPENENSPTVDRAGGYLAVRWLPATLFKQYGLWHYAPDGTPERGVLPGPDTTGYYVPLDAGDYALTRPKSKSTIALFSAQTGRITDLDSGVTNLPAQRIPGQRAISYTHVDSLARHEIRSIDLESGRVSIVAPTLPGRTAHVWLPGRSMLLMAKGNAVYARRPGSDTAWVRIAEFASPELRNLTAYVVSPVGDQLVLTSPLKLPLAVALRDSLEAGRPVQGTVAGFAALRDTGALGEYFLAEGALLGIAGDRRLRRDGPEEIALLDLIRGLFPDSHRVWARLGDAYASAKDAMRAREAWQKALALNPRSSAADREAAARVEQALKDLASRSP